MNSHVWDSEERRKAAADAEYVERGSLPIVRRRPVAVEVEGIDMRDAPDFCDAFISYAEWSDTGEPLTDDELEELNEDSEFVYSKVMDAIY